MKEKFATGKTVVYDTYGLCLIKEIKSIAFTRNEPEQDYYVLSPLSGSISTYYVPVDNEKAVSKLRTPLTKDEIDTMLKQSDGEECKWIENRQLRSESFNSVLKKGVSPELVSLIHCIYMRKQTLSEKGKSISSTDEGVFSSAERMLNEEFSFALGIEQEEVSGYISSFFREK